MFTLLTRATRCAYKRLFACGSMVLTINLCFVFALAERKNETHKEGEVPLLTFYAAGMKIVCGRNADYMELLHLHIVRATLAFAGRRDAHELGIGP
jgi:hypothetical protein